MGTSSESPRLDATQARYVVLLGCGAQEDLGALAHSCGCDEAIVFFVVDSRRPYDVENWHRDNVRLVIADEDEETLDVPEFETVHDVRCPRGGR